MQNEKNLDTMGFMKRGNYTNYKEYSSFNKPKERIETIAFWITNLRDFLINFWYYKFENCKIEKLKDWLIFFW